MTKILPERINKLKDLLRKKNTLYKCLKRRMVNSKLLDKLDALQAKLQIPINFFQLKYYRKISKKLSDAFTSPKCYWTQLKTLLNGRKIPCTPPIFRYNKLISDFKENSEILTPSLQNSVHKSIMEVYYCQSFILSQKNLSRMLTSW